MEMKKEVINNLVGGVGPITIEHILSDKEMHDNCSLYARVTIEPGSTLGYHVHTNESETYFIISGEGEYDDNGVTRKVTAGDVTYTPNGCGHGLKPLGDEPIVFMALIIPD